MMRARRGISLATPAEFFKYINRCNGILSLAPDDGLRIGTPSMVQRCRDPAPHIPVPNHLLFSAISFEITTRIFHHSHTTIPIRSQFALFGITLPTHSAKNTATKPNSSHPQRETRVRRTQQQHMKGQFLTRFRQVHILEDRLEIRLYSTQVPKVKL